MGRGGRRVTRCNAQACNAQACKKVQVNIAAVVQAGSIGTQAQAHAKTSRQQTRKGSSHTAHMRGEGPDVHVPQVRLHGLHKQEAQHGRIGIVCSTQ